MRKELSIDKAIMAHMNWRYKIGSTLNIVRHALLSSPLFPLTRYIPPGSSWLYDVQRVNGNRQADIIFDVGANVGQTAWGLVRYFPNAAIYCFEPVSATYDQLSANYGHYNNVHCVHSALGAESARLLMKLTADSERNTLAASGATRCELSGDEEWIDISTADQFCELHGIRQIDVLKMDVQGWELNVLKGCTLNPKFVYAEVGFRSDEDDMQHFSPFDSYMEKRGYRFGGLYDVFRYGHAKEYVAFANALYIRT